MRENYNDAIRSLAASQKSAAGVPAYLRWVNRPLGRRAAAGAYVLGLRPNHVTVVSMLCSLTGMLVLAFSPSGLVPAIVATALLLAGYALDSADGQLARLTRTGSVAGEWLDHVVDAARLPLFHVAVATFLFRQGEPLLIVGAALAYSLLASIWFFAQILAEQLMPAGPAEGTDAANWVSFAKLPYDVGLLYLTVLLTAWVPVFLVAYLLLLAMTAGLAVLSLVHKYRVLQHAVRAPLSGRV